MNVLRLPIAKQQKSPLDFFKNFVEGIKTKREIEYQRKVEFLRHHTYNHYLRELLKKQNPDLQIVAVEPAASPLLSGGKAGRHGLQGIGANFIPKILDTSLINEILPVTEQAAYSAAKTLRDCEGILVGISSGAALHAAITVAKRPENRNKHIAVIFPDGGDRYLSTELFN